MGCVVRSVFTSDLCCCVTQVTTAADSKGPQIECPLCHSKFSLLDGTVLEYCPKDGPMQWVVGTIKEKAPRENTKVRAILLREI